MGTRIGFVASEKGTEKECDVGLGLRMQKTTKTNITTTATNNKSFCGGKKMMTMMMDMSTPTHHHDHRDGHNNDPSSLLNSNGGFSKEQQHCGGPLFCNTSNNNNNTTSMSDIYDVGSFLFPNTERFMSYNSSGVMVSGANVRHNIPFTASQRQELETQTMIYRYMMASVPVPPQLLIPITKTTPNFTLRSLELGISSNSSDAEPWRCKRTDGKKWRCSRNAVPDQKYCERHSHKTRPRSRKHVEQNSHFNNTTNINNNSNNLPYSKPSSFLEQREKHQPAFSATSHEQPRSLEWFMKGHEAANSNQDWHRIVQPKPQQGSRATEFNDINHHNTHQLLPQQPQSFYLDQTRQYIDAWSVAERDHTSEPRSNTKNMPFSSLTLSMHGGNGTSTNSGEESGENPQMCFGIEGDLLRSQWLMSSNNNNDNNNSVSWDNGSPPGGPLAEALCLGMAGSSTRESSSRSS